MAVSPEDKEYIHSLHQLSQYKGYGDAGILSDIIGQHKAKNQGKLFYDQH